MGKHDPLSVNIKSCDAAQCSFVMLWSTRLVCTDLITMATGGFSPTPTVTSGLARGSSPSRALLSLSDDDAEKSNLPHHPGRLHIMSHQTQAQLTVEQLAKKSQSAVHIRTEGEKTTETGRRYNLFKNILMLLDSLQSSVWYLSICLLPASAFCGGGGGVADLGVTFTRWSHLHFEVHNLTLGSYNNTRRLHMH